MRTIPAREIKRRGISAVDDIIKEGPVHVIRNDEPCYVIMSEEHYRDLLEDHKEAETARIREALEDMKAGHFRRGTAQELINELGLED